MGFYFRRSVRFGPMWVNFSKSGVGFSAGVRGARISTGPRGTYVHAGTNGFYYSQKVAGPYGRTASSSSRASSGPPTTPLSSFRTGCWPAAQAITAPIAMPTCRSNRGISG